MAIRNNKNSIKKKIINEVTYDVRNMGLTAEEFEVTDARKSDFKGNLEEFIQITFAVKGNKRVIDDLISKGWEIDRRYKNDDGDPSIYASDIHGKNTSFRFMMIVLKYTIVEKGSL